MLLTMESKTAAHHKLEALIAKGRATASNVVDLLCVGKMLDGKPTLGSC
jgi:hypothetical protein